jgi:threonine/homoserine/homoserine lactone efflux protein
MLELITRGAGLGLTATVMPGPLQTLVINSALSFGWRKSIIVIFAPLIADIPVMLLTFTLLSQMPVLFAVTLSIVGGLFTLYLAWAGYRSYRAGATIAGDGTAPTDPPLTLLRKAVIVNILAPAPWLFWITVHGPVVQEAMRRSPLEAILYVAAFYGIFLSGLSLIVLVFARVGQISPAITRKIILFSILLLAFFGISLLWQGVGEALALLQNGQLVVN